MDYDIKYEHLFDKYCKSSPEGSYPYYNSTNIFKFKQVRDSANKHRLELTDEYFELFFRLSQKADIDWIMHLMSEYGKTLEEALVSYITY